MHWKYIPQIWGSNINIIMQTVCWEVLCESFDNITKIIFSHKELFQGCCLIIRLVYLTMEEGGGKGE